VAEWVPRQSSRSLLRSAQMTIADLIAGARNGSQRAAGRLLSLVEGERRDEVLASTHGQYGVIAISTLSPLTRQVHVDDR
jgi:hypothetical protein